MRLHTDTLTHADILVAARAAGRGIYADAHVHGSRSRHHAFEIKLETGGGTDCHGTPRRRRADTGSSGYGATYDEWGYFIAALFDIEPTATFGPYKSARDFDEKTRFAYAPEDPGRALRIALDCEIRRLLGDGQCAADVAYALRERVEYVRRIRDGRL